MKPFRRLNHIYVNVNIFINLLLSCCNKKECGFPWAFTFFNCSVKYGGILFYETEVILWQINV